MPRRSLNARASRTCRQPGPHATPQPTCHRCAQAERRGGPQQVAQQRAAGACGQARGPRAGCRAPRRGRRGLVSRRALQQRAGGDAGLHAAGQQAGRHQHGPRMEGPHQEEEPAWRGGGGGGRAVIGQPARGRPAAHRHGAWISLHASQWMWRAKPSIQPPHPPPHPRQPMFTSSGGGALLFVFTCTDEPHNTPGPPVHQHWPVEGQPQPLQEGWAQRQGGTLCGRHPAALVRRRERRAAQRHGLPRRAADAAAGALDGHLRAGSSDQGTAEPER